MRQQLVPTGVTIGPDGAYYVAEMTGFPFTVGTARIWRVTGHGHTSVVADGLTAVIDIAFDCRGQLYALRYKKHGFCHRTRRARWSASHATATTPRCSTPA